MAITAKPKNQQPPSPDPVDEFINAANTNSLAQVGDVVNQPELKSTGEEKALKLRLPVELLEEVDAAVKSRKPAPSRHQWILEAIYEKLEREKPRIEG